jgi:lysophospholipase L1-like esterase
VAIRTQGDEITPNTDRVLTFNGSATVTIPVGDDIVSDPVSLDVPDQSALAISLFVPEATGKLRPHSGPPGRYTYVSTPGDFTGAQSISSAKRTDNFYWVKSIEVEAKKNVGTIVAIGSSVCAGAHSTEDAYNSWPGYLSRRILAAKKQPRMAVVNAGIGGNRIIFDGAGESLLHRLAPDALDLSGVKYVVMYAGNNDIGAQMSPQVTADAIIDGIRETAKRCHAKGIKFIALTFAPCITGPTFSDNSKSGGLSTQQKEAMRLAINNWIRTTKEIDGYADVETIADPDNPGAINPIYDSGDHLHPNDAGYEAMADAIPLNLFK